MGREDTWWLLLPPKIRRLPPDLTFLLVLVVVTNASILLPGLRHTPLRIVLGIPFLLFAPGYALVAAMYPSRGDSPAGSEEDPGGRDWALPAGVGGLERVTLSFGASIALVPLFGWAIEISPWSFGLLSLTIAVSGTIIGATFVAAIRRSNLPANRRLQIPWRRWLARARAGLLETDNRLDRALNSLVVIGIIGLVLAIGYTMVIAPPESTSTEFYLLTENEDGQLVASGYPTEFDLEEGRSLVVGIDNNEQRRIGYTTVVELQRVQFEDGDDGATRAQVIEEMELDRFHRTLGHNETVRRHITIRPRLRGSNLRLVFLLYHGTPPEEPSIQTADKEVHLQINVSS